MNTVQRQVEAIRHNEFLSNNPNRLDFLTWSGLRRARIQSAACAEIRVRSLIRAGDYVRATRTMRSNGNTDIDVGDYSEPRLLANLNDTLYVHARHFTGHLIVHQSKTAPQRDWFFCEPASVEQLVLCKMDQCGWIGRQFYLVHRNGLELCPRCMQEV